MGLFGYDSKDYLKNSRVFQDKISIFMQDVTNKIDKATNTMVGNLLQDICFRLAEQNSYPNGADKDVLKQVDQRITTILQEMQKDLQRDDMAKFATHTNMLSDTVRLLRKYGAEMPAPRLLNAQDNLAEIKGTMNAVLSRKIELSEEMKKLEKDANKIEDDNDPRLIRLEQLYEDCEEEMASLDGREAQCRMIYNETRDIINSFADEVIVDTLPETMSPVELQRHFSRIQEKQEKFYERRTGNREVIGEYKQNRNQGVGLATKGESTIRAKRRLGRDASVGADIDNATVSKQENTVSDENSTYRKLGR